MEIDAYSYWKRVDILLEKKNIQIIEFCKQHGINYNTFKGNRSALRLCNTKETYVVAKELGVSVEYLLTGKDTKLQTYPPRIQAVVDILLKDDTKLNAVCTLLQIPAEKDQYSSYSAEQVSS